MNLVIDIGNSFTKLSIFRGNDFSDLSVIESKDFETLIKMIQNNKFYKLADKVVLSSVKNENSDFISFLKDNYIFFLNFTSATEVPVKNLYTTPETLGKDRLAAVVAANNIYKHSNVLIFDAGTALTIDFINKKGEYKGGCISPGLSMRFKALNYFTEKLPELSVQNEFNFPYGTDTNKAIIAGVQNGILNEVKGYIKYYKKEYSNMKIVFTGGDTFFFENRLKNKIFADSNLVLRGLNIILNYNV